MWHSAVPCEHTWSLINEISILALQFEHLTVGKKLDDRAGTAMTVAIFLPSTSPNRMRR